MKQKDILVYVLGETERDWKVCYTESAHVHQAAAMRKIVKLLEKDYTYRCIRLQVVWVPTAAPG